MRYAESAMKKKWSGEYMKNIERPEVLNKNWCQDLYDIMHNEKVNGDPLNYNFNELLIWLNSDYVEPHKWEQW